MFLKRKRKNNKFSIIVFSRLLNYKYYSNAMAGKNTNWNKRMCVKEIEKRRKKNQGFLIDNFTVEEVLDESGEVKEDTVIKFSFGGLLIYLSVASTMRLHSILSNILKVSK